MDKEKLLQDILDQVGDLKELARQSEAFDASIREWNTHYEEYRKVYMGKWVALHEGEVRASAESLNALLQQTDRQGIPRGTMYIQHVVETEPVLLL